MQHKEVLGAVPGEHSHRSSIEARHTRQLQTATHPPSSCGFAGVGRSHHHVSIGAFFSSFSPNAVYPATANRSRARRKPAQKPKAHQWRHSWKNGTFVCGQC
jgi:hypothetical protein